MRGTPFAAACALLAACSSSNGSGSDFATKICDKVTSCSLSVTNCHAAFAAIVLSSDCQSAFLNASCADLTANPAPPALEKCIPSCTGTMTCTGSSAKVTSSTCNGDGTVTECVNGSTFTYTCDGICAAESKKYSGTCAGSFNGQASPTGCPACWCE